MRVLLTADIHLRGDAPACRVDPDLWMDEQRQSVEQLYSVVNAEHCDEVWIIGDLFHRARTSTEATVQALSLLSGFGKVPVRVLPGNHDLLAHAYGNLSKSTIGTVYSLGNVHELISGDYSAFIKSSPVESRTIGPYSDAVHVEAYPFGTEPETIPDCDIWCVHELVFPDNESRPCDSAGNPITNIGATAEELVKRANARIIVTGDYHHGYVKEIGGTKVITCGCLNIQASDMDDYRPRVYVLNTSDYSVTEVPLRKFGKVHPDPKRESKQELAVYMEGLRDIEVPHLDFVANVQVALEKEPAEDVRKAVQDVLDSYVPEE